MGNMGLTTPRVILSTDLQLHFRSATVRQEVAEVVSGWFEDGTHLGLTLDRFANALGLQGQAKAFFETFDTDRNQKVDAFEVFSAFAILARGTIDEKIEIVFPIFDFAGNGSLNFDEVNILIHSVYRGLRKVCNTKPIDENEIIEVCRRLFDAHNLPYDNQITKEQVRRWLRNDVEAAAFLDVFHNALSFVELEKTLSEREKMQVDAFSQLCISSTVIEVSEHELSRSHDFRQSLGSASDEACAKLVEVLAAGAPIKLDAFTKAVRAWNVFSVVDASFEGDLDAKELLNLANLQHRQSPETKVLDELRERVCLNSQGRISRSAWIEAMLRS